MNLGREVRKIIANEKWEERRRKMEEQKHAKLECFMAGQKPLRKKGRIAFNSNTFVMMNKLVQ